MLHLISLDLQQIPSVLFFFYVVSGCKFKVPLPVEMGGGKMVQMTFTAHV